MAALEMDLPVIETLHSVSEIPGVKRQAEIMAARLPGVRVEYLPSGALALAATMQRKPLAGVTISEKKAH